MVFDVPIDERKDLKCIDSQPLNNIILGHGTDPEQYPLHVCTMHEDVIIYHFRIGTSIGRLINIIFF